jgi:ubiquinone/menaquinone biosynthesis C-methylase UbiE
MTAVFDAIADRYDVLWSETAVGQYQRAASWRRIDALFPAGCRVLDLGCGTGDDAMHLLGRGVEVLGIDESAEMTRVARSRGVDARVLRLQELSEVPGSFDGAISNFGVLNCVERLDSVAHELARLIVPGGKVALGFLGKCCLWEIAWYLARMCPVKAFRRARHSGFAASLGLRIFYPGTASISRVFAPAFRLVSWQGIGLAVPPSYTAIKSHTLARLAAIDRELAHRPLLRALSDHRLYVFQRL